ncbi:MAG: hypothetical protein HEQ32_07270 [Vampirovibrio sp.]
MVTFFQSASTLKHPAPELGRLTSSEGQALCQKGLALLPVLSAAIHHFWGVTTTWQLQGIWYQVPKAWQEEKLVSYHASLPRLGDAYEMLPLPFATHMNDPLLNHVLAFNFGSRETSLQTLSALEHFVAQQFLEQWAKDALTHLIPEDIPLPTQSPLHAEGSVTYVFSTSLSPQGHDAGPLPKVMLQVPLIALKASIAKQPYAAHALSWEAFLDWQKQQGSPLSSTATLMAGVSILKVGDLKALDVGDLLVLEHSSLHRLGLIHPQRQIIQAFPIQADLDRLEAFDPEIPSASPISLNPQALESDPAMMYPDTTLPQDAKESLWDQLHVEVHAEFKPMRIPIQELRHMSQGLLIEVGDLLHNEIQLVTNHNTIAYGHLVVVGDKFGVLLTKIPGQQDTHALTPLGETPAPMAPLHSTSSASVQGVAHGGGYSQAPVEKASEAEAETPPPSASGIDPQLVAYCQSIGLNPQLAQTAVNVGFNLQELVEAANQQQVALNDFFIAAFEQNDIPIPDLDDFDEEVDDLEVELNRTSAMMEEMEDLLGEDD